MDEYVDIAEIIKEFLHPKPGEQDLIYEWYRCQNCRGWMALEVIVNNG